MIAVEELVREETRVSPHILLMEDEIYVAKGLRMVLEEEGYDVDWAMTGQTALEKCYDKAFDLLVADLKLPDMNGMDVIRHVKSIKPQTEVIVITGYASVESAVEAMKIGVREYLPKPFTEDEFKQVVYEALKEKLDALLRAPVEKVTEHVDRLIERREVMRVLSRAADDDEFWKALMEHGSLALRDYALSAEAEAAILSGDIRWMHEHIGELTQKELLFLLKRREMEIW